LPPPALGAHTREVLHSLGVSADEFDRLKESQIVG
jgi:crotonobetainyl-CoA:carnitine CoA-transferase CaiB-like acyl-CoA transferase